MSKLDMLCDFSEQEKKVERYRKFEREVRPSCTFAVDDNWRMVPVRKLHPKKFAIAGTSATSTDSSDREDKPAGSRATRARTYHVSVPRKVIEESKFRLVHTNQNKHNSFSLVSHVHL